jgi:hypothetical protein
MATAPQTTPYDRYRISESRSLLFVPGGCANRLDLGLDQPVGHQRNHREQSEQYWRCPSNRQNDVRGNDRLDHACPVLSPAPGGNAKEKRDSQTTARA